jgi:transcriptional regulator
VDGLTNYFIFDVLLLTNDKAARYGPVDCLEGDMTKPNLDLLQGTLDMLILKTLALQSMHGWGISQRIQQVSQDVLVVNQGSLYPALVRLEEKGWIASEWGVSENNRRAKYYSLTRAGKKQLNEETETWERMTSAVQKILQTS